MADDQACKKRRPVVERARQLRKPLTPAETKLWRRLRGGQMAGFKFRRQHPLGRYIADFCCEEVRLVVEVDGDSHAEQQTFDEMRTNCLREMGYRVMRFTNMDVHGNLEGVLETILTECEERRGRLQR